MKYLVIIGNGLIDHPIANRDNKTVLQIATTPNLDRLAKEGHTGSVQTIPENCTSGNGVSFLSLLGYNPEKYCAGTGKFMAAALGLSLKKDEIPLCCDFVNLQSSHNDMIMKDYTGGQLSDDDAKILLDALQTQITDTGVTFYPAGGFRNLMVLKGSLIKNGLKPPDELISEGIRKHMPSDEPELVSIMSQAQIILHNHPYNIKRKAEGRDPVNSIWLSGNGNNPDLPAFTKRYGLSGSIVSASMLLRGMGIYAGLQTPHVEGATGFMDTNYQGKINAAFHELEYRDVVYLQIAAPEMVSMQGLIDDKVLAVEDFDRQVIGEVLQALKSRKDVKVLLTVNHMCSANLMKYGKEPVPFVIFPAGKEADTTQRFDEQITNHASWRFGNGPDLMDVFFRGTSPFGGSS